MSTFPITPQSFVHRLSVAFRTPVAFSSFCLSLAALIATSVFAASGTEPDANAAKSRTSPVFYETTTVTARPVDKASGSISIIGPDEIAASEARSAADLLRGVPGLNLVSNGGRAGVTQAYLRGGDPNFTLVLLDGIPLNDPTEMQGGAVNLEELSTEMIDHVEIVRGPLCAFYGVSSLSGVVQLFTRKGAAGPARVTVGAEAGDAAARRGYGTLSGKAGGAEYAAGASWAEESHRIGQDHFRQFTGQASTSFHLAPGDELRLTGRYATGKTDDYPDSSGGPIYGDGLLRHSQHDDVALGARLELGQDGAHPQSVDLSFAQRSRDRTSPAVPPIVPASEEDVTYSRLRAGWRMPVTAGKRTALDLGASGEAEWASNVSVLHLPAFMGGDVPGNYEKSRASAGAFTGLRQELGALTLEAALRVDAATTDSLQVNPHLGLLWRLGRGDTRLRASGGRAGKLASFTALASPKALGGNPDLKPERALGGEVGIEQTFRPAKLDASLALFRQEYRNLVDFDLASFAYVNRSRVRTQGAELQLGFKPLAKLRIDAELTWLDAKDLDGSLFLHAPRWVAGARLTWQPTPRMDLRFDYQALTRYNDEQLVVPERTVVAGHSVLGAAAAWHFSHGLTLRGRVDNLTDRRYENLIGFPGARRSGWVGVSWERL